MASPKPQFVEQKPFITQADIDNFFRRKLRKEFVGREAEAAEAEAFINEAVAEQRVT